MQSLKREPKHREDQSFWLELHQISSGGEHHEFRKWPSQRETCSGKRVCVWGRVGVGLCHIREQAKYRGCGKHQKSSHSVTFFSVFIPLLLLLN